MRPGIRGKCSEQTPLQSTPEHISHCWRNKFVISLQILKHLLFAKPVIKTISFRSVPKQEYIKFSCRV